MDKISIEISEEELGVGTVCFAVCYAACYLTAVLGAAPGAAGGIFI